MLKKDIAILSGPIRSGKSSALLKWCKGKTDVYGILTPIENGKRVFMDISTGEKFPMEAEGNEPLKIKIGNYNFSLMAFSKAVQIITNALRQSRGWLVIDEIGPLELSGKGFDEILREILETEKAPLKLILVVRDNLLDQVIQHYHLHDHNLADANLSEGNDALL